MGTEENKALVRRAFEEGMNQRNLSAFEELLDENYVNYAFPGVVGPAAFKEVMDGFFSAFPDMHITVEEAVAEGDRVATRGYMTGTQTGEFMGIPATGKSIRMNYMDIWRVENGKLVENWVQMDQMGLMQQLGVIRSQA